VKEEESEEIKDKSEKKRVSDCGGRGVFLIMFHVKQIWGNEN
jgi:hypothetical protein